MLPTEPEPPLEAAFTRGFEEGLLEGERRAGAALAPLVDGVARLARIIEREQLTYRRDAEQNVAAVGLAVARWLFQREVAQDPMVVQELVRRAVHLLPTTTVIEIRGHPADLQAMTAHLEITEADGRPLPVHWIADAELERGDFTIATPERLIDGRADVALRSLYDRLASE
ncbi:MAG: FliH/SctL family protein [Gemmatimonadales bacterium]